MMKFTDAILNAHDKVLGASRNSIIIGLGVSYPNGADGTTKGLADKYPGQLLDVPVSELSFTGMAVGMAASGMRPLVHHGRVEFAMLAFEQIITQASKWNYMFGGTYPCPFSSRICVGRQWGNGPQHTSGLHSIFLQTTCLEVYIPSTPQSAYSAILEMSSSDNPSVMLEHRWLYKTSEVVQEDAVPRSGVEYKLGDDFTIITYADGLIESLKAIEFLSDVGILGRVLSVERFPADRIVPKVVKESLFAGHNVYVLDVLPYEYGPMSGLVANAFRDQCGIEIRQPKIISAAFEANPTSTLLTKNYYPTFYNVIKEIADKLPFTAHKEIAPPDFNYLNTAPSYDFSSDFVRSLEKSDFY